MPLSKKRNRERMKQKRATCVQPKRGQKALAEKLELVLAESVQPVPNCLDGRYRELDADGNIIPDEF